MALFEKILCGCGLHPAHGGLKPVATQRQLLVGFMLQFLRRDEA
jgi:hypothetical protein